MGTPAVPTPSALVSHNRREDRKVVAWLGRVWSVLPPIEKALPGITKERATNGATKIKIHPLAGVSFNPEVICQGKSNQHILN